MTALYTIAAIALWTTFSVIVGLIVARLIRWGGM